jgi:tRNA pseudouridine55 synthase
VTDDAEGDLVTVAGAAGITADAVRAALPAFTGVVSQVPSSVSAIKVDGKRAYAVVRAGGEVALKAREVTVSRFDVLDVRAVVLAERDEALPVLDLDVVIDCTSGTYIRALARDLGATLGCGGHLTALRRTRVGGFGLDLVVLDSDGLGADTAPAMLDMAEVARLAFDVVEVDAAQATEIGFGRALELPVPADPTALVHDGRLLALYRPGPDGRAVPVAVLA